MNKANECTCPSGDGSLVHPCPAHPAVEQACWDERKLSDLGNELHNLSCSIVHENEKLAEQIGGIARELWNWPQARAALAQPSPAQAEQAEAERPEVFGLERYRVEKTGQGFWPYCVRAGDGTRELFAGHLKQCKRVAAQLATAFEDGKFVAGALRAENAKLSEALDRWPLIRDSLKLRLADALARVAELESKLAELERQEPVAWGAFHFGGKRDGKLYTHCETEAQIEAYILDMHRSSDSLTLRKGPLYGAPVAQAQHSVPEGWRIERSAERIVVMNLKNGAGYAAARDGESGIAESVLYLLQKADGLLMVNARGKSRFMNWRERLARWLLKGSLEIRP
ncbi:hypothetical protein [Pseudomonas aeruginosa]|uniref:hypothetical protein n=1 Tax=Pseudomonas aeruginosa TaxID=287 RepID=UPI001CD2F146|nr:hypothetical protein [Pseudomonas aeruginosa]